MADNRLDRLARVYGVGECGAFDWAEWVTLDAAVRKFLAERWPEAAAAWARMVAEAGMNRAHPVGERELLAFLSASRRCLGPWLAEVRVPLADLLDPQDVVTQVTTS